MNTTVGRFMIFGGYLFATWPSRVCGPQTFGHEPTGIELFLGHIVRAGWHFNRWLLPFELRQCSALLQEAMQRGEEAGGSFALGRQLDTMRAERSQVLRPFCSTRRRTSLKWIPPPKKKGGGDRSPALIELQACEVRCWVFRSELETRSHSSPSALSPCFG